MMRWTTAILLGSLAVAQVRGPETNPAAERFEQLCSGCHGKGGVGGDRAPALVDNRELRSRSEEQIADIIKNGTGGGMPAFSLPAGDLHSLASWLHEQNASAFDARPAGDPHAGEIVFFGAAQCSTCHMVRGRGSVNGPDLSDIGRKSTVREIELVLQNPTSQLGAHTTTACPGWAFCPDEAWAVVNVSLHDGSTLRGFARHEGEHDVLLQTFDAKLHFLTDYASVSREKQSLMPAFHGTTEQRRDLIAYLSTLGGTPLGPVRLNAVRETPATPGPGDWPTYNGTLGGNRYSELSQINAQNVRNLKLECLYSLHASGLETTPVVSDGILYVTAPGKVCALEPRSGSEIWCYSRDTDQDPKGAREYAGTQSLQPNRGVAVLGDRVFFATGNAHLVCLNRLTGGVMWEVNMPVTPGRYSATSAPLVVGDLVVSGIGGGDGPLRGFIAAYKAATGELAWRFWTVPESGEPASATWTGKAISTGGGATWLTGSYDAETDALYWTVGNPYPATDGDEREGTNLYTNCVLALEARTGKLRWYYQFTPHDLHDWDATEPVLLVDTNYRGHDRKLLLQANRSGFFYVLDRTNGELLLAKPFVKRLNWSSGIGSDGRPQLLAANQPTKAGTKTCPAVRGATNWYATAFHPSTKLFYVMAVEDCSVYKQAQNGGYEGDRDPSNPGLRYFRALDISTGEVRWEIPQVGPQEANYSGVLATAGGLVFYGETAGRFAAADAQTGKPLWTFKANDSWRASPMTYLVNGRQYVAIASGGNILSFALEEGK